MTALITAIIISRRIKHSPYVVDSINPSAYVSVHSIYIYSLVCHTNSHPKIDLRWLLTVSYHIYLPNFTPFCCCNLLITRVSQRAKLPFFFSMDFDCINGLLFPEERLFSEWPHFGDVLGSATTQNTRLVTLRFFFFFLYLCLVLMQ